MSDGPEGSPSLRVPPGETVLLSPESDRFRENYRAIRPGSAQELRALIGLSDEGAAAARKAGACCPADFDRIPSPGDLDADDELVREAALSTVARALPAYLRSPAPKNFALLEPAIGRFLELSLFIANLVVLRDIHVADGATLTISEDTHLLQANRVVIEGTGRIDSSGYLKLSVNSIQGV